MQQVHEVGGESKHISPPLFVAIFHQIFEQQTSLPFASSALACCAARIGADALGVLLETARLMKEVGRVRFNDGVPMNQWERRIKQEKKTLQRIEANDGNFRRGGKIVACVEADLADKQHILSLRLRRIGNGVRCSGKQRGSQRFCRVAFPCGMQPVAVQLICELLERPPFVMSSDRQRLQLKIVKVEIEAPSLRPLRQRRSRRRVNANVQGLNDAGNSGMTFGVRLRLRKSLRQVLS